MIYTCYEMVRDCRADKPEGWSYFVSNYVPVVRKLLAHYFPERAGDGALIERVLRTLRRPESSLFQMMDPAPERIFVAELRQQVLAAVESDRAAALPPVPIEPETLLEALAPLTMVERQAVWFETMHHTPVDVGRMMRMDPKTVEKIRQKAGELVRGKVDAWSGTLLADNGAVLGRAAAATPTGPDCPQPRAFLDMIDGRTTWQGREQIERHVGRCLFCLDHFCRLLEVVDIMRTSKPLPEEEAEPLRRLLGVEPVKKAAAWKRLFGAG